MKIGSEWTSEWTLVGTCGVDSGQLLLTDPCYLPEFKQDEFQKDEPSSDYSYNGCCHATSGTVPAGPVGIGYSGVATATGYGDGTYPVYAKLDGGRVRAVMAVFESTEEGEC